MRSTSREGASVFATNIRQRGHGLISGVLPGAGATLAQRREHISEEAHCWRHGVSGK